MAGISRADRADDAALLAGLGLGDPVVAAAFIRRFQRSVYGLAVSITRDARVAEDVSQEVFLRAWRAADTYDIRHASVLTWLLTITRNAAIDAVRARRATPAEDQVLDQLLQEAMNPGADVAQPAVHRVESDRAIRRLHEISPAQARAVVLAVLGGRTAAEVAEHEGIAVGTAKTRIRSGLLRLRRLTEVDVD